jgi:hypothetical protein
MTTTKLITLQKHKYITKTFVKFVSRDNKMAKNSRWPPEMNVITYFSIEILV